jgi:hypothetical protein
MLGSGGTTGHRDEATGLRAGALHPGYKTLPLRPGARYNPQSAQTSGSLRAAGSGQSVGAHACAFAPPSLSW